MYPRIQEGGITLYPHTQEERGGGGGGQPVQLVPLYDTLYSVPRLSGGAVSVPSYPGCRGQPVPSYPGCQEGEGQPVPSYPGLEGKSEYGARW